MTLIQTLLRSAAPALAMAAMFAAAPASAGEKVDANDKRALINFRSCAKPMYPADAIKAARTGTVTLGFLIGAEGTVDESRVNNSSGHADLDEAARNAIAKCKFEPAVKDGKPVKEWMQMQYKWTLN